MTGKSLSHKIIESEDVRYYRYYNIITRYYALLLQYHRTLSLMPTVYNGCDSAYNLSHALHFHKGGLVTQCHNKVRDALGSFGL